MRFWKFWPYWMKGGLTGFVISILLIAGPYLDYWSRSILGITNQVFEGISGWSALLGCLSVSPWWYFLKINPRLLSNPNEMVCELKSEGMFLVIISFVLIGMFLGWAITLKPIDP